MKKIILLILCLALTSLACLQTVAVAESGPTPDSIVDVYMVPTGTATAAKIDLNPTVTESPATCARVIAQEALHLRSQPNEHAVVLAWLRNGDQVTVISASNADWWLVGTCPDGQCHEVGELVGFARSTYLSESECE